jgi:biopolymer transport protein ExbD
VLTVAADGKTLINKIEVEREELPRKLIRMLNARPDNTLYLDGADEAEFGHVLGAVDLAKEAQAWPIVFLTTKME